MKKTLTKVTAILSIVFGALGILGGILILGASRTAAQISTWIPDYYWGGYYEYFVDYAIMTTLIIIGILLIAFSITSLVLGSQLLKKPENSNGTLIAIVIISFLGGSIVTTVFAIIALCMSNDTVDTVQKVNEKPSDEFMQAVGRLKQYLADGIITETVYKQKLAELAKKNTDKLIESVK